MSSVQGRDPRASQRDAALRAAARILEAEGMRALTARRLAAAVGCSVGTLYNLFENADAIIAALNLETLSALGDALDAANRMAEPREAVLALAHAYLDFTTAHRSRWEAVLTFAPDTPQPALAEAAARLVARLDAALEPLCPGRESRGLAAAVLWTGLEGIVALGSRGHTAPLTPADAKTMARCLVETFLAGLAAQSKG